MATPNAHQQTLVREFAAEGLPVVVIADRLGVSRGRVEEILRDMPPAEEPTLSPEAATRADDLLRRLNGARPYDAGGVLPPNATFCATPMVTFGLRPEGAVAFLSLPLTVAALVETANALEMGYGPGLRLSPAEGGVWVLGAAS